MSNKNLDFCYLGNNTCHIKLVVMCVNFKRYSEPHKTSEPASATATLLPRVSILTATVN